MAQVKSSQGRARAVRRRRSDWLAEVKPLREQGLSVLEIARRLGIASTFVYQLLNDPDGSKDRARKNVYRRPCPRCGTPMNGSDPGKRSLVCARCAPDAYRIWTREAVIASIQDFARIMGRPPVATDWPSLNTVQQLFGSWANGIEAAGFPRPRIGARPSDPGYTDWLREIFADGQAHTLTDLRQRMGFDFSLSLLSGLRRRGEIERVAPSTYRLCR